MEGKGNPGDDHVVFLFKSINTPGDEITPGSYVIRKNLEHRRFTHITLPFPFADQPQGIFTVLADHHTTARIRIHLQFKGRGIVLDTIFQFSYIPA
jgi:hypothetical protein